MNKIYINILILIYIFETFKKMIANKFFRLLTKNLKT